MVEIHCIYFKPSGKYYSDATERFEEELLAGTIYPRDIGQLLNERGLLPGLVDGTWDGPFVVHPTNAYPELVTG